jgi:hypothetical protein
MSMITQQRSLNIPHTVNKVNTVFFSKYQYVFVHEILSFLLRNFVGLSCTNDFYANNFHHQTVIIVYFFRQKFVHHFRITQTIQ